MSKAKALAMFAAAMVGSVGVVDGAAFIPGDLAVTRIGGDANDGAGTAALTSGATQEFIDEYTPAGVYVQTIALPTTASGGNLILTDSGSGTSDGQLTRSVDGQFLTLAGYNTAAGTAGVVGLASSATANQRAIGLIGADGSVNTSTGLTDAYSGNNIRSVVSVDGAEFWTAGTASTGGGVRYVGSVGATTSTQLSTTITNTRVANIANGQLYASSATGAFQGVSTVGTGVPTTSGQTISLLSGFPTATGPSSYDYFFADSNTVYVADDRSPGTLASPGIGGLQKWVLNGSTWTLDYTLNAGLSTTGLRGLTGIVNGGIATFYATAGDQSSTTTGEQTALVTINDVVANSTLPTSAFVTLATSPTNTVFRGVDFAPVAVPEPVGAGMMLMTGLGLLRRKRRQF